MPKITIYVPDDLKSEMDAVEDQDPNWSAFAQDAFRLACRRITNIKRGGKMELAIERLRASKERLSNEDKVEGHRAGREWAAEDAEFDELQRLAAQEWGYVDEGTLGWLTYKVIVNDDDPHARDCYEFWKNVAGVEEPSDALVEAFTEGATEVFNEVEGEL